MMGRVEPIMRLAPRSISAPPELDLATAPRLVDQVTAAIATQRGPLTLDVGGVEFIDVAGIRALERCRELAATAGVELTIENQSRATRRVAALLGVSLAAERRSA